MIDLHVHTTASDGVLNPEQMVKEAKKAGLTALGICDHDQVGALDQAIRAGGKYGLEIVPGTELSCYWLKGNRREFHILGYYFDYHDKRLSEKLIFFQNERRVRAKKSLVGLRKFGYQADWKDLLKIAKGAIGRPHIAQTVLGNKQNRELLVKTFGKIPGIGEFIEKYLIAGKPAYVEKAGFEPKEAIDLIHQLGGVAVLAHPGFDVEIGDLEIIRVLKNWGIDGLEVLAPVLTPERTQECIRYFTKMAKDYKLLMTGGSDYHGLKGIGAGLGMLEWGFKIDEKHLMNLKKFVRNN